jgi:hypothetical protein
MTEHLPVLRDNRGMPPILAGADTVAVRASVEGFCSAATARLLLDAGVDVRKVQEPLGHKHVTIIQTYDNRRRSASGCASRDVPI